MTDIHIDGDGVENRKINIIYRNEGTSSSTSDRLTTLEGDRDTVAEKESSFIHIVFDSSENSNR